MIGIDFDDCRSSLVGLLRLIQVDYELDLLVSKGSDLKNDLPSELLLLHQDVAYLLIAFGVRMPEPRFLLDTLQYILD